ncbi:MAG: helix-turn-helix transcriptional regulator [Nitrososphaerales archaeon]
MEEHPRFEEWSVNERIKYLRESILGIDKGKMAREVGITWSSLKSMEEGKIKASKSTINRIYRTYGVNPEWLLTGKGEIFKVEDLPERRNAFTFMRWILQNIPILMRKYCIKLDDEHQEELYEELYFDIQERFFVY